MNKITDSRISCELSNHARAPRRWASFAIKAMFAIPALVFVTAISASAQLYVCKFYDTNANGKKDTGEQYIYGWRFEVFSSSVQLEEYTPAILDLAPDKYTVVESTPLEDNWINTTSTEFQVNLHADQVRRVRFGNVCLGAGGGFTLGYWSNKNGQALLTDNDFAALTALHLRNEDGSDRDFTSGLDTNKADLKSWLLGANAVNMSYMLSVQLAAMVLNVNHGSLTEAHSSTLLDVATPAWTTILLPSMTLSRQLSRLWRPIPTGRRLTAIPIGTFRSA
jgi:hypothetical protein